MADKPIENGDIVRVHMTGRVNSYEGPVFQVTEEEVARAEGMIEEDKEHQHQHYGPKLVIVGKNQVITGVDEALVGMKIGEEKKIEIEPDKAYGQVDAKKKRVMAFREFRKKFKKAPRRGDYVDLPNSQEQGRIIKVDQGKVTLDTNHILAGRTVYFTLKVVEKLEGEDAKIKAMIEQRLPGIPADDVQIKKLKDRLDITVPSQAVFYQQFGFMQYMLAMELQREFENFEKVRFIVDFEKPKQPEIPMPEPSEEKTEEKGEEPEIKADGEKSE
ncbi:MAG: FKBP-type peptidyl-prolyl cis-trans isomerase [Candidatus Hodarchaeota archaeon]